MITAQELRDRNKGNLENFYQQIEKKMIAANDDGSRRIQIDIPAYISNHCKEVIQYVQQYGYDVKRKQGSDWRDSYDYFIISW